MRILETSKAKIGVGLNSSLASISRNFVESLSQWAFMDAEADMTVEGLQSRQSGKARIQQH